MIAAHSGGADCVRALLAAGWDSMATDKWGLGVLRWAAIGGDWPEVAGILVAAGADVRRRFLSGKTVIEYASSLGRQGMLRVLR